MSIVQQDADEFIRDPEYVARAIKRVLIYAEDGISDLPVGPHRHWAQIDIEILRRILDGYGYETRT